MRTDIDRDFDQYWRDRHWLDSALHELPAGVLYGADGATPSQCRDMIEGLNDFAKLCDRLGLADHRDYIESCRWHFDHYPHYLSRQRHLTNYDSYIRDRKGPRRVTSPPQPPDRLRPR